VFSKRPSAQLINQKSGKQLFKPKDYCQIEYEFVSIDELVPVDDHLLRLIDKYIDFSFLLEKLCL
jgi:hypothetical protein